MHMNFPRSLPVALLLGGVAVHSGAAAATSRTSDPHAVQPPRNAVVSIRVGPQKPAWLLRTQFTTVPSDPDFARWSDIKDLTYDQRPQFSAGLGRLQAKVGAQVAELTAKRTAMPSTVDTREWDFAMQEMTSAEAAFRSMNEEVRKAAPEFWDQVKERVGQAWERTQTAFTNVKTSTTS